MGQQDVNPEVEGWRVMDASTLFVIECKDRHIWTEHKDIMDQLGAVS